MAAGTVMRVDRAILGLVPVGEENAVTTRLLWQVPTLSPSPGGRQVPFHFRSGSGSKNADPSRYGLGRPSKSGGNGNR
jgi:hypothetical protein